MYFIKPEDISNQFNDFFVNVGPKLASCISLLYMQKTAWNSDIWNFFSEKIDFFFQFCFFFFTENPLFESGHV